MTMTRSLNPRSSGSSEEITRTAPPLPTNCRIRRYTSTLAPTSMPCVGSSTMIRFGSANKARAKSTFCWLPPLKVLDELARAAGFDPELLDKIAGHRLFPLRLQERSGGHFLQGANRDVAGDAKLGPP